MNSKHFSHFGTVLAPAGANEVLDVLVRRTLYDVYQEYPDIDSGHAWAETQRQVAESLGAKRPHVLEECAGAVSADAWELDEETAILLVDCPSGGWAEAGIVSWPLCFTAPAAIAGACCAPRYGLAPDCEA